MRQERGRVTQKYPSSFPVKAVVALAFLIRGDLVTRDDTHTTWPSAEDNPVLTA